MTRIDETVAGSILIVEDDEATAELERRALTRAGMKVRMVTRVQEALALIAKEEFVVILLDYNLPDGNAWQILDAAQAKSPRIPVVLVTAMGSERVASEALQRGVADYLKKADSFWDSLPGIVDRVTRLARAEAALANERQMLARAEEFARLGSWEWNLGEDELRWSEGCYRIFGQDPATYTPNFDHISGLVLPEDREHFMAKVQQARTLGGSYTHEYRVSLSNGGPRTILSHGKVLESMDGRPTKLAGTVQDITERKQAEAALRESELRFRSLFYDAPVGHALNRLSDGWFLAVNDTFATITGHTLEQLNNLSYWDLTPKEYAEQESIQLDLLKATGRYGPYEKEYIHKDGRRIPVGLMGSLVTDHDGTKLIMSVVSDITERKQGEAERERLIQDLQNALEQVRTLGGLLPICSHCKKIRDDGGYR